MAAQGVSSLDSQGEGAALPSCGSGDERGRTRSCPGVDPPAPATSGSRNVARCWPALDEDDADVERLLFHLQMILNCADKDFKRNDWTKLRARRACLRGARLDILNRITRGPCPRLAGQLAVTWVFSKCNSIGTLSKPYQSNKYRTTFQPELILSNRASVEQPWTISSAEPESATGHLDPKLIVTRHSVRI